MDSPERLGQHVLAGEVQGFGGGAPNTRMSSPDPPPDIAVGTDGEGVVGPIAGVPGRGLRHVPEHIHQGPVRQVGSLGSTVRPMEQISLTIEGRTAF